MERTDLISERQLSVLAFSGLLSPLIRMLPRSAVYLAGRSAWLSPAAAAAAGAAYFALMRALLRGRGLRDGLAEMAGRALGSAGGKVFCAVSALWLTFYAGFIARSAAERLLSSVYTDGSAPMFSALLLAASAAAAACGTKTLARTAEIFAPVILGIFALVIAFALPDVRAANLLPVTYKDAGRILLGSLPITDIVGASVYFLFLLSHVEKKPGEGKQPLRWMLLQMLVILGVMVITVGSCGEKLTLHLGSAFFMVIRNISILGVIERVEALVITIWITTDFLLDATLLMTDAEILRGIFGAERRAPFVIPAAAGAAASALLAAKSAFGLQPLSELLVPAANLFFAFILIPAVLAVGKLRKKL